MKKTICNREYDTETATRMRTFTYGYFGDPAGYEEHLYRTPDGFYFIYGKGGKDSPYPTEDIRRLGKAKVKTWLESR